VTKFFIPVGWRLVKFGDVVENMNETARDPESIGLDRVVGLDHMDPESLSLKRWDNFSDLHEGTSFTRVFRAGQVLFGKRRAYQRKVSLPNFDGVCSGDILVFQPKNEELLSEFLPYLVQSDGFFAHALGTSAGSLSPRTKWQELAKYEFVLPPIAEQHRIVELISLVDDMSNRHDCVVKEIEKIIVSTSVEFLESSTVDRQQMNKVAIIERGVSYKSSDYVMTDDGRPFLTLKAVTRDGQFSPSGIKWVRSDFALENVARPRDLFFANTDLTPGRLLVGAPFFFTGLKADKDPCFSMDLSRVQAIDGRVTNEYLYFVLNLPRIRKEMRRLTGGSTVGHLRLSGVAEIEVPVLDEIARDQFLAVARKLVEFQSIHFQHIVQMKNLRRNLVERCLAGASDV
jgi:type I restriction enzyme S subunit